MEGKRPILLCHHCLRGSPGDLALFLAQAQARTAARLSLGAVGLVSVREAGRSWLAGCEGLPSLLPPAGVLASALLFSFLLSPKSPRGCKKRRQKLAC